MLNVTIHTYGCKVNLYNSELLLENLLLSGQYINNPSLPIDLLIVNACVVTKNAEKEVVKYCKKNQKKDIKVIVFGCLSPELKEELKKNDILFEEYENLLGSLVTNTGSEKNYLNSISNFQNRTRAFIKVQNGCNQYCSYCIVPYVRGDFQSRSIKEILAEVKDIVDSGYKEIVLTGTQIGLFNDPDNKQNDLLFLMKKLETEFQGDLFRIRISSIGPTFISDSMIDFLHHSTLFCNHLHISLQSGSDSILKRMNRKYSADFFLNLALKIKALKEDFCISTDVIVGFPGETESDFQATKNLCEKINFSKIHVFPFSPRYGTEAYQYKTLLSPELMKKRTNELLELSKTLSYNVKQEFIGKNVEVLVEEDSSGYTTNYLRVVLQNRDNRKGQLASVSVGSCDAEALYESNLT